MLTTRLLSHEYQKTKLVATLKKFFGRHHGLVNKHNVAVSRIVMLPTSKKLVGHIASETFIRWSVRSSRFLVHSITLDSCMLLF